MVFCLCCFFFLMIRRPPRSTPLYSSAASDVYKRQDDYSVRLQFIKSPLEGCVLAAVMADLEDFDLRQVQRSERLLFGIPRTKYIKTVVASHENHRVGVEVIGLLGVAGAEAVEGQITVGEGLPLSQRLVADAFGLDQFEEIAVEGAGRRKAGVVNSGHGKCVEHRVQPAQVIGVRMGQDYGIEPGDATLF